MNVKFRIFLGRLHPSKLCLYGSQNQILLQVHKNVSLDLPLSQAVPFNIFYDISRFRYQSLRSWPLSSRILKILLCILSFPSHVAHISPSHTCRWYQPTCVNNKTVPHYLQFMSPVLFILSRIPILSSAQRWAILYSLFNYVATQSWEDLNKITDVTSEVLVSWQPEQIPFLKVHVLPTAADMKEFFSSASHCSFVFSSPQIFSHSI